MMPAARAWWPRHLPLTVSPLTSTIYDNLAISAARYPDKAALLFYGATVRYAQLKAQVDALAGYLQHKSGVRPGDRVLLYMQNCPQFVIGYYAILRAGGVAVPVNAMYRREELRHIVEDTGAIAILCAAERHAEIAALRDRCPCVILVDYSDALDGAGRPAADEAPPDAEVPDFVRAAHPPVPGTVAWRDALAAAQAPTPTLPAAGDLCMILYSSGTTGRPKGCMYTHRALSTMAASIAIWSEMHAASVLLMALPLFHIGGIQTLMNAPIFAGAAVAISARWNRDTTCRLTDRYQVSHWTVMPTMMVDLLDHPRLGDYDLGSVRRINGGGAAMPASVAEAIERRWGIPYIEGYGLSETGGGVLGNPPRHAKRQCLGIPLFDVDARIVDPVTQQPVPQGEAGEILLSSEHLFSGYWRNEPATDAAFVRIDGKRFLRTGDIGRVDGEGYFYMVDRLKRMVNASGFKVWPAEIESMLHEHPAVREACVVSAPDAHRGETVKAVIVLKAERAGEVTAQDIIDWSRERMAAFKYPRIVEFVDALPLTPTGKVDWRRLQEARRSTPPC